MDTVKPSQHKKRSAKIPISNRKKDEEYSWIWHAVKKTPNIIVKNKKILDILNLLKFKNECLIVTNTPDLNKIKVFKKGTLIASKESTPTGGHSKPFSKPGLKEKWK